MTNPFFYLAGLLIAFSYPTGIEPLRFAGSGEAPWAAALALVAYALVARLVLRRTTARMALSVLGLRLVGLLIYAALIYGFHFPLWLWTAGLEDTVLVGTVLTLAPLLALYGLLALEVTLEESRRSGGARGVRERLGFGFRLFLGLSFLPLLAMLSLDALFQQVAVLRRAVFVYPFLGWVTALAAVMALMAALPRILRSVLGARPLPPGPLRDRLETVCRASKFRCADLFEVGAGGGGVANAFIVGLSPAGRSVFFTRSLLRGMSGEELDAVLAHEIVHSQKRHILFYLFFALGFSLLSALGHEGMAAAGTPAAAVLVLVLAWAVFFWGVVFGFVSRRFESEADLVAARMLAAADYGAAPAMAAALVRVAWLNGVPPESPSWRHFSIARRVEILRRAGEEPSFGSMFERGCRRLRTSALAVFLAGLAGGTGLAVIEAGRAGDNRALLAAYERVERGRALAARREYEEALRELRAGLAAGADDPHFWLWVADAERGAGREDEARRAEETARRKGVTDPRARLRLQ